MNNILRYKNFSAHICFSPEDNIFFGRIAEINDSVSFEGASITELENAFREAIEDYLETCKQIGKNSGLLSN